MFSRQLGLASFAQVPNPKEILDLQIKQGSREVVPIFSGFVPGRKTDWASWVVEELSDEDFVGCLELVGFLESVVITKNLEGFKDAKGLRHLVRRWSPFLHTFFFFVGELTITLEDVINNFLLPVFGDENPFDIQLSVDDLVVKEQLFKQFSRRTASPRGKAAEMENE